MLFNIPFKLFNIIISLSLLFNNAYFIQVYNRENYSINLSYYILVFLSFYIINYIIYIICFSNKRIFKSIIFILILISFVTGYYSNKYKLNIDAIFIINIINELNQTKEIVSIKDIMILFFYIFSLTIIMIKVKITPKVQYKSIKSIFIHLVTLLVIFTFTYEIFKTSYINLFNKYRGLNKGLRQEITLNIYPYKYFYLIKEVIKYYKNNPSNEEILATVKKGDVKLNKNHKKVVTIFVVSDSIRAKNTTLFGYKLNTTPSLKKLYDNKKIYIFKQNVCFSGTLVSLNCMLSLKSASEFRKLQVTDYSKEKITKYFNYLNIDTYYLYNNEVDFFYSGYKYIPFAKNTPTLDREALPFLFKELNSNNESKFITLNLRGAHIPYDLMLDNKFKKFPQDYDNKILQTDDIWNSIIKYLSDQPIPVFVIFTSDHGQSLGEYHNGIQYFVHGAKINIAPVEQKETPLVIYVNNAYEKLYPDYVKNIKKNMKKYQSNLIESDVISHSLLDCSLIEGKVINKSLSLCR